MDGLYERLWVILSRFFVELKIILKMPSTLGKAERYVKLMLHGEQDLMQLALSPVGACLSCGPRPRGERDGHS